MAIHRWQIARVAALVCNLITLVDAKGKSTVMVEEERCHVIVEDIEEHVGLFLIEPGLDWLEPFKDGAQAASCCLSWSTAKPIVGV